MIKFIKNIRIKLYLLCSECDGMCNHCNNILKEKCYKIKDIVRK